MNLPDFPFTITYCPATKSEPPSLGIEARIGTRRLRAVTEICPGCGLNDEELLSDNLQQLLEQIADTHVFQEAYGITEAANA